MDWIARSGLVATVLAVELLVFDPKLVMGYSRLNQQVIRLGGEDFDHAIMNISLMNLNQVMAVIFVATNWHYSV